MSTKEIFKWVFKGKPERIDECPLCGHETARLGGGWCQVGINHSQSGNFRVEFCLNPACRWIRKLWRPYREKHYREVFSNG